MTLTFKIKYDIKLEKSLYRIICGQDLDEKKDLKMFIIAAWPDQLSADNVATWKKVENI